MESIAGWVSITWPDDDFMSRTRRHFTAEQKARIVRRHLAGKEPASKLAEELGLQPSQIHAWVAQVLGLTGLGFVGARFRKRRARRVAATCG